MSNISFKPLGRSVDPKTNHTIHEHGIFSGDVRTGTALVAIGPENKFAGVKMKGIKTGDLRPLESYLRSQHPDVIKAKTEGEKLTTALAATVEKPAGSAPVSGLPLDALFDKMRGRRGGKQAAICDTPDCGGKLQFQEVRNKHGFTQTVEHCPNCGKTQPVRRRMATAEDSATATRDDARAAKWKAEDKVTKAFQVEKTTNTSGPVSPDKDPAPELDHDRMRIKSAVRALLGKKQTPFNPDGKVNKTSLVKSIGSDEAKAKYQDLLGKMQMLAGEVARRAENPKMHSFHDHAGFMLLNAREQLSQARRHMLQEAHSKIDHLRGLLGRQPLHMKHLEAADHFITAAKTFAIRGDREMHAAGHIPEGPTALSLESSPPLPASGKRLVTTAFFKVNNNTRGAAFLVREINENAQRNMATAAAKPAKARLSPKTRKPPAPPKPED